MPDEKPKYVAIAFDQFIGMVKVIATAKTYIELRDKGHGHSSEEGMALNNAVKQLMSSAKKSADAQAEALQKESPVKETVVTRKTGGYGRPN